jgi:hypothetical protein
MGTFIMLSPCNLYLCYPLGVINEIFTLSLQKKKKKKKTYYSIFA